MSKRQPISPAGLTDAEELRNIIVKHTSRMLDNPDKYGIYPTTKFYGDLEKDFIRLAKRKIIEWRIEQWREARHYMLDSSWRPVYDRLNKRGVDNE